MNKKIILGIGALILISIPTYFYVSNRMLMSKMNDSLQTALGKDQGLTEMILRMSDETITYREVFELCEKSVSGRNDLLIELRGLYPNIQNKLRDSLAEFLSIENEIVRLRSSISRKEMSLKSSQKYISQLKESAASAYYYYDVYNSKIKSELAEMYKMVSDWNDEKKEFSAKYTTLLQKENNLKTMMASAGLRFLPIYSKYKSANIEDNYSANQSN